jgi:hypothetical protein
LQQSLFTLSGQRSECLAAADAFNGCTLGFWALQT